MWRGWCRLYLAESDGVSGAEMVLDGGVTRRMVYLVPRAEAGAEDERGARFPWVSGGSFIMLAAY